MKRVLGILFAGLVASSAAADEFKRPVELIIQDYIRPAVDQFAQTATNLPQAVKAVCADPNEASVGGFTAAFSDTVRDYAGIYFLRFGPGVENDRSTRLAFMPDPRGISMRQIRKLYAAQDQTALNFASLADKSVAVQGLTALQLIAFDKNANVMLGKAGKTADFTCAYASSIAGNIASIADEINAGWQDPEGYSKVLLSPGPDNDLYRTDKEALEAVYNILATGLTVARDQNLLPALGKSAETAKPRRIPFSRSGNGILFLSSELKGIEAALSSMDLKPMVSSDYEWLFDTAGFEFRNAQNALSALTPPIRQTLDKKGYGKLAVLSIILKSVRELVAPEMAGALGLAGGFNALDGD